MTIKPVKFISDIQAQKQIIKTDISGNIIFAVSGSVTDGHVSSSIPISASNLHIETQAYVKQINISGSTLTNIGTVGPILDVYEVFSAIDSRLTGSSGGTTTGEVITGSFDADGSKNIQLSSFLASDLESILVDVLIKESGSVTYKNDLISYELSGNIGANKVHVLLSAPALTDVDSYRVIASKTNDNS